MSETHGMAYDALHMVRQWIPSIQRADNLHGYEALRRVTPFLACWQFGHPDQPKARKKWRQQPWRCDRCGTWWITENVRDGYGYSSWFWTRVEEGS